MLILSGKGDENDRYIQYVPRRKTGRGPARSFMWIQEGEWDFIRLA